VFINKLDSKNAEASSLRAELEMLKNAEAVPSPAPVQETTYATKTAVGAPKTRNASAAKSKRTVEKKIQNKSRKTKATARFMVEISQDTSVASAKVSVWEMVKAKTKNPSAKTIVSGKTLIIIPDNANTLEVIRGLEHAIENDVDSGTAKKELTECLMVQNVELGLTAEDVGNMTPLHKSGPRDGNVVHWVIEVPPG